MGFAAVAITVSSLACLVAPPAVSQGTPPAPADTATIPAGEWDDDWWYPEGRITILGQRSSLMAGVTLTRFTSGANRGAFGALQVDPSVDLYRPEVRAGLATDVDLLWVGLTRTGNRAGYVAPTLGIRYAPLVATRAHWLVPFVSVRGGPYFASTSTSGSAIVLGVNTSVGLDVARRLRLGVRYDRLRSVRGHDLPTMSLDITIWTPPFVSRRARPKLHECVSPPGRMVDVGGRRMHLVCAGTGSPTVVLGAGLSDARIVWDRLLPELAAISCVCAYDRAGIGYSEPGPPPRDSRSVVRDLHALLQSEAVPPPYVLVGHSFGGVNVRLFAAEHRHEVAGLVLVDATHEDLFDRYPPAMRELSSRATEAARAAAALGEQGLALPPLVPNLPLPVVTAGRPSFGGVPRPTAARMRGTWNELQADLVRLSPQSEQVIAKRSGHYVMRS